MHPYGIDSNERRNVLIFLVPISFGVSELFVRVVARLGWLPPAEIDWIFDPASAAAWFGVLYLLFENYVWKWSVLRVLGVVQLPNLNGNWNGTLKSSYDDFRTDYEIEITIKQSWTRIIVELATSQSSSKSDTASVYVNRAANPMIVYTYLNIPNPDQPESMEIHTGTTKLELGESKHGEQLAGSYYSDRGRRNHGQITVFKREP
jgi:hypothetical protein